MPSPKLRRRPVLAAHDARHLGFSLALTGILLLVLGSAFPAPAAATSASTGAGPAAAPLSPQQSVADTAAPGSISGSLRSDRQGEPLDYANIVVRRKSDGVEWGTLSLGGGRYFFSALPPGEYSIKVLYLGYETISEPIRIVSGRTLRLDYEMTTKVVRQFDERTIMAREIMMDAKASGTEREILNEDIVDYGDDSVRETVSQQAGFVTVAGELHVRGSRGDEILWQVDGVQVNNPLGGSAVQVGMMGVANVESVTGGMDAEFGNALAGTINVSTREGGENFEARIRYLTDDFGRQDRSFTNTDQFSMGMGGPTPVPRLTWFASGDIHVTDQEHVNHSSRPESRAMLFGTTVAKWRRRQLNRAFGSVKLAYALDSASRNKITAEYIGNYTDAQPYSPNWDVQGYARGVLLMPEIVSTGSGFRYTGRSRRVFHGPWVATMHQDAHAVRVAYQQGDSYHYESMPVLWLRDVEGRRFLAGARPLLRGFRADQSVYSTAAEDSSFIYFNSADRAPRFVSASQQLKLVFRHQFDETTFFTLKTSRVVFDEGSTAGDLDFPYEYNHGGIRAPGAFAGTRNVYAPEFYTDADHSTLVTTGDFPVYLDRRVVQNLTRFDITSRRYAGHRLKSGFLLIYNDLAENLIASPARERSNRFTGEFRQGGNANVFRNFNPEASFYIQDQWAYEGMVLNAGLRWDMFSPGSTASIEVENDEVDRNLIRYKSYLSPRIGIAFPITDRDAFHFHYGRVVQFPDRADLFASQDPIDNNRLGNPNLDAQLTIAYQAGIKHQFSPHLAGQMVVYNRDIYGLIATTQVVDDRSQEPLGRAINQAYASARGLEFTLEKRYADRWAFRMAYSYAFANGVASDPLFGSNPDGLEFLPNQELPLNWDQRHGLNARLRVAEPRQWAASVTLDYGSGLPWTPVNRFERKIDPLLTNSRRGPARYDVTLQGERQVNLYGQEITLFLQGHNLLDQYTVANVSPGLTPDPPFADSAYGSYLTETGKYGGAVLQDTDGDGRDEFVPMSDPRVYGPRRSFRIGVGWQY